MFLFVFKEFNLNEILLHKYSIGIMAPHYDVIDSNHSIMLHAVHKVYENLLIQRNNSLIYTLLIVR